MGGIVLKAVHERVHILDLFTSRSSLARFVGRRTVHRPAVPKNVFRRPVGAYKDQSAVRPLLLTSAFSGALIRESSLCFMFYLGR
jgi:hypothetical protein